MVVTVNQEIYKYYRNPTNITVKVNEMSNYFRLERLKGFNLEIKGELIPIEIDENDLEHELLQDKSIFTLMAVYAMGTGQ